MKKLIPIILLLALIGGGIYYYLLRPEGDVVITGIVTTDDVIVSSQVQGRLKELRVDRGNIVKKDELIATIENDTWLKDMSVSENTEEQMRRQVAQAEANVRFEELQTTSQIAQAEASLAAAEAQIAQSNADLENAHLTFIREEGAYKSGAESLQVYDQARTGYDAQKARVEAATKQRDAAKAAVDVAKASTEQIAERKAALEMTKSQLAGATAQKEKAGVELGYTEIHSPIDGIVDVRAARQGEVITPAQPIITLIDPDKLWIRADVEESYVELIHNGDVLKVRLPSGAVIDGKVYYRSVDADYATQRDVSRTKRDIKTFEIRLQCDNTARTLAVGMTAYVTLPTQKK